MSTPKIISDCDTIDKALALKKSLAYRGGGCWISQDGEFLDTEDIGTLHEMIAADAANSLARLAALEAWKAEATELLEASKPYLPDQITTFLKGGSPQ